jgi:hypothetical protein
MVFSYRKRVKTTNKTDRLRRLKSVDKNLRTEANDFWKYVTTFKKNDHYVTQLKMCEKGIIKPKFIADNFCPVRIVTLPLL